MKSIHNFILSILILVSGSLKPQNNYEYTVDTNFKVTFDGYANFYDGQIGDFLVEDDGKIMITGTFRHDLQPSLPRKIARLNPDGGVDHSFSYHTVGPFSPENPSRIVKHNECYYVGYFGSPGVARFFNDGTVDTNFYFDYSGYIGFSDFQLWDLHIRNDDRVMIAGYFRKTGQLGYGLIQLNADGSIDSSFYQTRTNFLINKIQKVTDTSFLIGGWVSDLTEQRKGLWRIFGTGALDTSFNTGASWGATWWINVLPDGKIVCTGTYNVPQHGNINLVRWCENGELDSTFTCTHIAVSGFVITDNRIIVGGLFESVNGLIYNKIAAFDTCGKLDTTLFGGTFGPDSTFAFSFPELGFLRESHDNGVLISGGFNRFNNFNTYTLVKLKRQTVGIIDPDTMKTSTIEIFPNPVRNILNIRLTKSFESVAEIYDVHGRLRNGFIINPSQIHYSIPVGEFENGLYLLRISGLDVTATVKFMVNH